MPVTKSGLWDALISRNLRDGSALQIGSKERVEDIVEFDVLIDAMLEFHDSPESRDHRQEEIVNG
jgi:hypothetical protein